MKKPRKKQGPEYEFLNMFMDAINWEKLDNLTLDDLKNANAKEKEKEKEKEKD